MVCVNRKLKESILCLYVSRETTLLSFWGEFLGVSMGVYGGKNGC